MFTGIVEEMGTVKAIRKGPHSAVVEIQAQVVLEDLHIGDSIAVNGVCLTATAFSPAGFTADVMHETLNRSALALLRPGSRVNLERALAAGGRFGGHIVAPLPISEWEKEYATLSGQRTAEYTKLKETRAEVAELHNIRKCVDIALKADQPEQTQSRTKRQEQER